MLQGASNFRSLGGLVAAGGRRIRSHALMRADRLHNLSARDWLVLQGFGLATIVDLRCDAERHEHPNRVPEALAVREVVLGIDNDLRGDGGLLPMLARRPDAGGAEAVMCEIYARFPKNAILAMRGLFDTLRGGGAPVLVHCAAGKDRTGFTIALLLHALGVDTEVILADYLASQQWQGQLLHGPGLSRYFAQCVPASSMGPVVDAFLTVKPTYLAAAWSAIHREFGSLDDYLNRAIGLTATQRRELCDTVLE